MSKYDQPEDEEIVLGSRQARQASSSKTSLRVLLASLGLAFGLGIVLITGFWSFTPTAMDYSSGGKLGESQGTPPTSPPSTEPSADAKAPSPTQPAAPNTTP